MVIYKLQNGEIHKSFNEIMVNNAENHVIKATCVKHEDLENISKCSNLEELQIKLYKRDDISNISLPKSISKIQINAANPNKVLSQLPNITNVKIINNTQPIYFECGGDCINYLEYKPKSNTFILPDGCRNIETLHIKITYIKNDINIENIFKLYPYLKELSINIKYRNIENNPYQNIILPKLVPKNNYLTNFKILFPDYARCLNINKLPLIHYFEDGFENLKYINEMIFKNVIIKSQYFPTNNISPLYSLNSLITYNIRFLSKCNTINIDNAITENELQNNNNQNNLDSEFKLNSNFKLDINTIPNVINLDIPNIELSDNIEENTKLTNLVCEIPSQSALNNLKKINQLNNLVITGKKYKILPDWLVIHPTLNNLYYKDIIYFDYIPSIEKWKPILLENNTLFNDSIYYYKSGFKCICKNILYYLELMEIIYRKENKSPYFSLKCDCLYNEKGLPCFPKSMYKDISIIQNNDNNDYNYVDYEAFYNQINFNKFEEIRENENLEKIFNYIIDTYSVDIYLYIIRNLEPKFKNKFLSIPYRLNKKYV